MSYLSKDSTHIIKTLSHRDYGWYLQFCYVFWDCLYCSLQNVPWDCREAALAITMTYCCYFICKYMQILYAHYISVISAQKKMFTLLYLGLHCLPYFPPHQLGMLKHPLSTSPQCLAETCVEFTFLWASLPVMLSRATVRHRGTGSSLSKLTPRSGVWSLPAGSRSHSVHVF